MNRIKFWNSFQTSGGEKNIWAVIKIASANSDKLENDCEMLMNKGGGVCKEK